ncbi:SLC13/DASS family transporter [bacterium]|nr:SLC13/DASS family transporter [bacterium]
MTLSDSQKKYAALAGGLVLFTLLCILPPPEGMSLPARNTLAVTALMAFWWITEAIPIPATALLPVVLFPLMGVQSAGDVASQYGDRNIFLFLGGFLLAAAIQKWDLHKRIALKTVAVLGTSPRTIIFGMMAATAFLSMWISNTATAMMMLPIALALLRHTESLPLSPDERKETLPFGRALMFGIGYAASIGGIGTLIGTPPNIIFASAVQRLFPGAPEISFFRWFLVGFPLVLLFLPFTWFYLVRLAHSVRMRTLPGGKGLIRERLRSLGPMSGGEKGVLTVFVLTALGWMFRRDIVIASFTIPGWSNLLGLESAVHDSTVAVLAAVLLFLLPGDRKGTRLLDWESALKIPWGILLLFGGGLALAAGFQSSGLTQWIGSRLTLLQTLPVVLAVLLVVGLIDFLTEVTSNTAVASIFMPILAATSLAMGVHPYLLMIAGTIAASLAFMLPAATPPNAVIFSSGAVTLPQMARTGFWLNIAGMLLTTIIIYLVAVPVFGLISERLPEWIQ